VLASHDRNAALGADRRVLALLAARARAKVDPE
jgi:hypothetical protein